MILDSLIFFLGPLLVANIVHHFIIIKYNIFPTLAAPIDFKQTIKNRRIFGNAKTFRGFFIIAPLTSLFSYLISLYIPLQLQHPAFIVGAITGLGYMAGELPNSFLKRRAGVPESGVTTGRIQKLFFITDHTDSVLGALLFLYLIESVTIQTIIILFFSGTILHVFLDLLLRKFSYKKKLSV